MDKMKYEELKKNILSQEWDFNNEEQRETILELLDDYPFYHTGYGSNELLDRATEYINTNIANEDKKNGIFKFLMSDKCHIRGLLQTENYVLDIVNVYELLAEESLQRDYEFYYEFKLFDAYKEIILNYQYMDITDINCLVMWLKEYDTFKDPFISSLLEVEEQIILALALYSEEANYAMSFEEREAAIKKIHTNIIRELWSSDKNKYTFINVYERYMDILNKLPSVLSKEIDTHKLYADVQNYYFKTLMLTAGHAELTEQAAPVSYNLLMLTDFPDLTEEEAGQFTDMIDHVKNPNELQQKIRDHAQNFLESSNKPC